MSDWSHSLKQQQQQQDYSLTPELNTNVEETPHIGMYPIQKETINEAFDEGIKNIEKEWTKK